MTSKSQTLSDAVCLQPPTDPAPSQPEFVEPSHQPMIHDTQPSPIQGVDLRPNGVPVLPGWSSTLKDQSVENLTVRLHQALTKGDKVTAVELVSELAERKADLKLDDNSNNTDPAAPNPLDKEIRVKVYFEDKDHSGTCRVYKLKPSTTIKQLKRKMLLDYKFPEEVQRWVIGKKLPKDNDTLAKHGIKHDGSSIFLYFQSARSIGLSRQRFKKHLQEVTGAQTGAAMPHVPSWGTLRRTSASSSVSSNLGHSSATFPRSASRSSTISNVEQSSDILDAVMAAGDACSSGEQQNTLVFNDGFEDKLQASAASNRPNTLPADQVGWTCEMCTYINRPLRPGCMLCAHARPAGYKVPDSYDMTPEEKSILADEQAAAQLYAESVRDKEDYERRQRLEDYHLLEAAYQQELAVSMEPMDCPICMENYPAGEAILLRDCLHAFCRECLASHIEHSEEAVVKCPFQDDYTCNAVITEQEIKALVTPEIYAKHLQRSLQIAESQDPNSYHCKTPDCRGWCVYEDEVNMFDCPLCDKQNCLTCKAIHEGMNCQQYQVDLQLKAEDDGHAKQTQDMLKRMLDDGSAMHCPGCGIILQKKEGCDWLKCTMCKLEICWVTKGKRWGPDGPGDISEGCRCGVAGTRCHPECGNCH